MPRKRFLNGQAPVFLDGVLNLVDVRDAACGSWASGAGRGSATCSAGRTCRCASS